MTLEEELKAYRLLTKEIIDFYNMDTYDFTKKYGYGVSTRTICDDIRKVQSGHKLDCTIALFRGQEIGKEVLGPHKEINCSCGLAEGNTRFLYASLDENNNKDKV